MTQQTPTLSNANSVMETLTTDVLKELECPVCKDYMVQEISLCKKGHSLCKKCEIASTDGCPVCKSPFIAARNYNLEKIASTYIYPCRNEGCDEKMGAETINYHEKHCKFALYPCALYFTGCAWKGKLSDFKEHVENDHYQYVEAWHNFQNTLIQIVFHARETFVLFSKKTNGIHMYSAVYVGTKKKPEDYTLNINFVDQTGQGYRLSAGTPCVFPCKFEEVFSEEKIILPEADSMLPLYFLNHNNEYTVKAVIEPNTKRKGLLTEPQNIHLINTV